MVVQSKGLRCRRLVVSRTLFRYFDNAPESLYIKAEPGRGRYEPSEVEALKERIEKLIKMVGKLTLENEALRQCKQFLGKCNNYDYNVYCD